MRKRRSTVRRSTSFEGSAGRVSSGSALGGEKSSTYQYGAFICCESAALEEARTLQRCLFQELGQAGLSLPPRSNPSSDPSPGPHASLI